MKDSEKGCAHLLSVGLIWVGSPLVFVLIMPILIGQASVFGSFLNVLTPPIVIILTIRTHDIINSFKGVF